VWDGKRWRRDDSGEAERRAKTVSRLLLAEASEVEDPGERNKLVAHAQRSEAATRVRDMLWHARSEPGIPIQPIDLDADSWLLNVANGTLDLRTGELHAPDRADHITKLAPVEYDPHAECSRWLAFLDRIMAGKTDLIEFLQRAIGYSLTGDTGEQVLFLLHGAGANGKTTLIETVRALLGEYALQTPAETLLERRDGVPNDVARLRGARFVAAVETAEGRRLDETMVKRFTGGDSIPARFMRGEWFEFIGTFKLWLATNHRPVVRGTDEAIWRRVRLVPFDVTIPEGERDPDLLAKLREELPGILRWAVAGCVDRSAHGLGAPADVVAATAAYREDMDVLGGFLADRCVIDPGVRAKSRDLYATYGQWCEETGERPLTQKTFGMRLAERGFEQERTASHRWWKGVGLVTHSDQLSVGDAT
jgi:putative DNA primase/helicase